MMGEIWPFNLKNSLIGIKGNTSIKIVSVLIIEVSLLPLIMNGRDGTKKSVSLSEITRT